MDIPFKIKGKLLKKIAFHKYCQGATPLHMQTLHCPPCLQATPLSAALPSPLFHRGD